jgi:hypothetical protein
MCVKTARERLDSYVMSLVGLGAVGLVVGVGVVALASAQFAPGGWLVVGWIFTVVSAMAMLTGMIGHAVDLAAQGIIDASARPSDNVSAAPAADAAASV